MAHLSPLLTAEQVASWVSERSDVARQYSALGERLADLDKKLAAVELLLPSALAGALLHPENTRPRAEASFTELAMEVLSHATRGLAPNEVRNILIADPEVGDRAQASHNGVTNALSRLLAIKKVVKKNRRYYLPETLANIESGETVEDVSVSNTGSFNATMHLLMQKSGKPFTAKEALLEGKGHPPTAEKISDQPSRVYSWLSREVAKGKLIKTADVYTYPNENRAPAEAGALEAGEVAASPNDNRQGFRLVG